MLTTLCYTTSEQNSVCNDIILQHVISKLESVFWEPFLKYLKHNMDSLVVRANVKDNFLRGVHKMHKSIQCCILLISKY